MSLPPPRAARPTSEPAATGSAPGEGGGGGGSALERLFHPWPVVIEEASIPTQAPPLSPEEALQVALAAEQRRIEFATGRACARRALARLGIADFILLNDEQRAPCWPAGVVGALTHTGRAPGGYCAVAVARATDMLTLGLDAERADALPTRLWRLVLTAQEHDWLRAVPADQDDGPGVLAKVMFSAKECFYKAQFPLTRSWLHFHDVEIFLDPLSQAFQARLAPAALVKVGIAGPPLVACDGRFVRDRDLVITAIGVPR